ncbi:TonB-dependent receptor [Flavisolibacter nicotianae]|uniref:TonB-dependent receptor n=1 Tax=Flavisolibacter nicotianae TaxID=2364882 RepID=UPI000EB0EBD1|nr:TonB-dependent receptor [Flavisolibacter nicotianae]
MKQIVFVSAFVAACLSIQAQAIIKGRVIDAATNSPLAGATILYAGTKAETMANGAFTLDCGKGSSVTASYVGYASKQVSLKNCYDDVLIALEPSTGNLEKVEITATSNQNKSLLYQPQSVTKIGATEIRRGTGLFLDDAINSNVPGVTMQRRTVSAGQQFNIRGYGNGVRGTNGPQSNFDGQGYKVYLNGIPVTDAEGITLMDDIDFGSIGNVEVVKGPAGTLYGPAIAGVVSLRTVRPAPGKTSIGQETTIGRYGLLRSTTSFQMGGERSSLLVNYGYQESDGFMAHTASEKRFMNAAGDIQVNDKQTINFYAGHANSYDERGGELTIAQYSSGDYSGNPAYIKNGAHSHVASFRGGVGHTYRFNNNVSNTTTLFGTAQATDVSSAGGWTDKNPVNYGLRSTLETRFSVGSSSTLSGITGVETQTQYAETLGYPMGPNPADPNGQNIINGIRSNQYTRSGVLAYFTEWTLALPHDLSVTAGLGNSVMKIELNDRVYAANKPTYFFRKYDNMLSPHFAVNKVFSKELSLYAAYSKGYKAPVSSYFFIPYATSNNAAVPGTGIVNTGLVPEKGTQYEVGSKGSLLNDKLNYQLAVFQALFESKMSAVAVSNGAVTLYSYIVNAGRQNNRGVEVSVGYTVLDNSTGFFRTIRPFGNLTYSDFKYENYVFLGKDYNGNRVAGIPKFTTNLGVDLGLAYGLYANAVYTYKDPVYITLDQANRTSSYNILNAKLGIRRSLSQHFDLDAFVGATNLTGVQYYNMVFVNQLPDAYLPAPRDAFYFGGLNLKYNF